MATILELASDIVSSHASTMKWLRFLRQGDKQ
jgi:hypothetical protein